MKLTSHFANNKVTLFDFELAEHMNFQYGEVKSDFKLFPRVSERNLVSLSIGVGSFVLFYSLWQYYTAPHYFETDVQRGSPLKQGADKLILAKHSGESERENQLLVETITSPLMYTERKLL